MALVNAVCSRLVRKAAVAPMAAAAALIVSLALSASVSAMPGEAGSGKGVSSKTVTLDNGLTVVLHSDKSDPVVAVAILYHVGSARETPGKTGFAHLFEHIMFQESENVPQDQFFKIIQEMGGTLNGGTWEDGTIYYEVVPRNALETVLWMESDRMGWLLGALTPDAFFNQQNVVMNEKRQSYDNKAYGNFWYVLGKTMYPETHPYNWQVIGSMTDLANASVDDAKAFFQTWYGPDNATLVIAGDFDEKQALDWANKYFGEIPGRGRKPAPKPMPVTVDAKARVYYEDSFARVPQITLVWPTVPMYDKDEPALDLMSRMLADGKTDILYRRLVEEKKLTSEVAVFHSCGELAGSLFIQVRPLPGVSLDQIEEEIGAGLAEFASQKPAGTRLEREKAKHETQHYEKIEGVFIKSMMLAQYAVFKGDPDYAEKDLQRYLDVTPEQVHSVFMKYMNKKPYVMVAVVPKGQAAAAPKNSAAYVLPNDDTVKPKDPNAGADGDKVRTPADRAKTPCSFDRSARPALSGSVDVGKPRVFKGKLDNGIAVYGVTRSEVPLVRFTIDWMLPNGSFGPGATFIAAELLKEGTKRLSPAEFQQELELLGASLDVYATVDSVRIDVSCTVRNYPKVAALVSEMLMTPRVDPAEFERLRAQLLTILDQKEGEPAFVASRLAAFYLFGPNSRAGVSVLGDKASVQALKLDNIESLYRSSLVPSRLVVSIVGDVDVDAAQAGFKDLAGWKADPIKRDDTPAAHSAEAGVVYLVDFPGAPQSEIRAVALAPDISAPEHYQMVIANYPLGGNFASVINMILREEKGYTYGARSVVGAGWGWGLFGAQSAVQANATAESLQIVTDSLVAFQKGIPEEVWEYAVSAQLNASAREYELLAQQLEMVRRVSVYGLPVDYVAQRQQVLTSTSAAQASQVLGMVPASRLIYVVAGDAKSVKPQLEAKGFRVLLVDKDGKVLDAGGIIE